MEDLLLKTASNQGIWALLAVVLIIYILQDSRSREKKLMDHLEKSDSHLAKNDETQRELTHAVTKISDNMIKMQSDIENLKHKEG